jgi:hypothetical protein
MASRSPLDWFRYMVGWSTFRSFAAGKATWMLNYSWDGDKNIDPREAMQNLLMAELMAGVNPWDAQGHVMSGSNDRDTRQRIFAWIAQHERTFYAPRQPMQLVGVYFSPATRNYFTTEFLNSYQGVVILLLQNHSEYQVVTPRSLSAFSGKTLVLPDVRVLSDEEKLWLSSYVKKGGRVVITGTDLTSLPRTPRVVRFPECPGKVYMEQARKDFAAADPKSAATFLSALGAGADLRVRAPALVAAQIANVEGRPHIFFANFQGLVPGKVAAQEPARNVIVSISASRPMRMVLLPFLGERHQIIGKRQGARTTFVIPQIDKGAVAWLEPVR